MARIIIVAPVSIYTTQERDRAVKEGDPKAQFLLVRAGCEIAQDEAEKYLGATALLGVKPLKKQDEEKPGVAPAKPAKPAAKVK